MMSVSRTELPVIILRYGMAVVFIWFAGQQLGNPERWVSFLPEFTASFPISQTTFVMLNGLAEVAASFLLLLACGSAQRLRCWHCIF